MGARLIGIRVRTRESDPHGKGVLLLLLPYRGCCCCVGGAMSASAAQKAAALQLALEESSGDESLSPRNRKQTPRPSPTAADKARALHQEMSDEDDDDEDERARARFLAACAAVKAANGGAPWGESGRLARKVAIVTGGGKGIGAGIARAFAEQGACVVLADLDFAAATALAAEITASGAGGSGVPLRCDARSDLPEAVRLAVEGLGQLDVLVNNAGWHPPNSTVEQTTQALMLEQCQLHIVGPFLGIQAAAKHLELSKGAVINVSSTSGIGGQELAAAYSASKAGLIGLTKSLAIDLGPRNIKVNCICPGGVMTPLMDQALLSYDDPAAALAAGAATVKYLQPEGAGQFGQPSHLGAAALFLATSDSSYVTGQVIVVDGGSSLG